MRGGILYFLMVFVLLSLYSCKRFIKGSDTDGDVVAVVGDSRLYVSDVVSNIPSGVVSQDSVYLFERYVNDWAVNRILVDKAELNLINQEELENKVQNYRDDLLVETYIQGILEKFSDKFVISEQEIETYYNNHRGALKLKENIVNVRFFVSTYKISKSDNEIRKMMTSDDLEDVEILKDYCEEYSAYYHVNDSVWLDLDKFGETLRLEKKDVRKGRFSVHNDSLGKYYYIYVRDIKAINQVAPYHYVRSDVENLLSHRKRLDFIKEMKVNLLKKSVEKGKVTFIKEDG